jgi:hypothetical protein
MNATTTVAAQALRFARISLLAVGVTVSLAGSIAPAAADSLHAPSPDDQSVIETMIGRPDFSLAQPDPSVGTELDFIDRLPNELPDLRRALFRLADGIGIGIGSDLVGSCVGYCTGRSGVASDARVGQ